MELGELEFKPEDFICFDSPTKKLMDPHDVQLAETMAQFSAEHANLLLRERLAKGFEVFARDNNQNFWHAGPDDGELCGEETHRARLVCIEEIGK